MIPAPVGNQCPICAGRMREGAIGQASYRVRTAAARTPVGRMMSGSSVTRVLLGANLLMFLMLLVGGLSARVLVRMGALVVVCFPGRGCGLPTGEWWRLFSAMFVHINVLHIAFNMFALMSFGPAIEHRYGKARFLSLYLISGLLGSAASITFNTEAGIRAGASGAIFGILGAWIAFFFRHRSVAGARAQLQSLLFLVGINVFIGVASGGRIDNFAHLGGLVGGFVIASALESSVRMREGPSRTVVWLGGYAVVLVVAISLTAAHTITL